MVKMSRPSTSFARLDTRTASSVLEIKMIVVWCDDCFKEGVTNKEQARLEAIDTPFGSPQSVTSIPTL